MERADIRTAGDRPVGGIGGGDGLGEQGDDGVEVTVDGVDAGEQSIEDLAAARLLLTDQLRDFQGRQLPELAHRPIMTHP